MRDGDRHPTLRAFQRHRRATLRRLQRVPRPRLGREALRELWTMLVGVIDWR